jgi:quercetin dioxygenase-like cupin family protein
MRINADFSQVAVVVPSADDWVRSPKTGVDRLMLDRIGEEVARATSIVRYAPGSSFPEHLHAKGEEFLVLEGVFSDESGDYPAGTYVRNPPGSSHAPSSKDGCRILVKLRQFDPADLRHVVVDTNDKTLWAETYGGIPILPLHRFGSEEVLMRRLAAGEQFPVGKWKGGTEILVVSGSIEFDGKPLGAESWLRSPPGQHETLAALAPTTLWIKTGHLDGL